MAIDDHVGDVTQQPRGPILSANELEQRRRLVDEARRAAADQESRVRHQIDEERDVRLDAADAELLQAAQHPAGGIDEAQSVRRHLDQHRIVKRRDDGPGERRAGVEADAHAAGRAIIAQLAVIRQEVVGRIFGRDAALQSVAVRRHPALIAQADFRIAQRQSLGDEDLTFDHIVAGHFLGDGMLDLNARIDLDKVEIAALHIDKKLDGAGIVQMHGFVRPPARHRGCAGAGPDRG